LTFPRRSIYVRVHLKDYELLLHFTPEERGDLLSDGLHFRKIKRRGRWWNIRHR